MITIYAVLICTMTDASVPPNCPFYGHESFATAGECRAYLHRTGGEIEDRDRAGRVYMRRDCYAIDVPAWREVR